jgi:hypothetical protein
LAAVGRLPAADAGFGRSPFSGISSSASVLDAVAELVADGTRALAVVDEESGRLVGQFSARCLRGIGPKTFYRCTACFV